MNVLYNATTGSIYGLLDEGGLLEISRRTVEQVRAEDPTVDLQVVTLKEARAAIRLFEDGRYLKEVVPITEDVYREALEGMPPEKYESAGGVVIFRQEERLTGDITGHYACIGREDGDDWYGFANFRTTEPYSKIALAFREAFAKACTP